MARGLGDGDGAGDSGTGVRVGVETGPGQGNVPREEAAEATGPRNGNCHLGRRNSVQPEGRNHLQRLPRSLGELRWRLVSVYWSFVPEQFDSESCVALDSASQETPPLTCTHI